MEFGSRKASPDVIKPRNILYDEAEIVKHFKIVVTCFSARVSRRAGI